MGGDGLSWATAFSDLQPALIAAAANAPATIRIAQGRYVPSARLDAADPRSATFSLSNGVELRGGYAGVGAADPDAHDPELNTSRLSGDVNDDDAPNFQNRADNVHHVLYGDNLDATAVLNGLTISGGHADVAEPSEALRHAGGGMLNNTSSPAIRFCIFSDNWAEFGGAMYNRAGSSPIIQSCAIIANWGGVRSFSNSNPSVDDCVFCDNQGESALAYRNGTVCSVTNCLFENNAAAAGAGIRMQETTMGYIADCVFVENAAGAGGALHIAGPDAVRVKRCNFIQNTAGYFGGAAFSGAALYENCYFTGNQAAWWGGAIQGTHASLTILNCAISRNHAVLGGGAVGVGGPTAIINSSISGNTVHAISVLQSDTASLTVQNSILWGNSPQQVVIDDSTDPPPALLPPTISVWRSAVQGGWEGKGGENFDFDPLFVQAGCDDLRLAFSSPCLDVGNNDHLPPGTTVDLAGLPRIQNGNVDLGAYEGGYPVEQEPMSCASDMDEFEIHRLVPGGGAFNPMERAAAVMMNEIAGPDHTATATLTAADLHPGAGGFDRLGQIMKIETSMPNAQYFMRIVMPFSAGAVPGDDPLAVDLIWHNVANDRWRLAVAHNVQNSPDHSSPIGDRIIGPPTWDVGDYGIFWDDGQQRGYVWANVDHASDFSFGLAIPCPADVAQPEDGIVDRDDLAALIRAWGSGSHAQADLNGDGVVDVNDLLLLLGAWGACP